MACTDCNRHLPSCFFSVLPADSASVPHTDNKRTASTTQGCVGEAWYPVAPASAIAKCLSPGVASGHLPKANSYSVVLMHGSCCDLLCRGAW